MNSLLRAQTIGSGARIEGIRRRELQRLVWNLESWLPAEEERLDRARLYGHPLLRRERDWTDLVRLYERLCLKLGSLVDVREA